MSEKYYPEISFHKNQSTALSCPVNDILLWLKVRGAEKLYQEFLERSGLANENLNKRIEIFTSKLATMEKDD